VTKKPTYEDLEQRIRVIEKESIKGKKAEEDLRESEHRYRILVENASESILVLQDGMIKYVNKKAEETFGYSRQEFQTIPIFEVIHPDDREQVIKRYLDKIHGNTTSSRHAYRLLHKNGQTRWAEIKSVLIDWEGQPATWNLISDITERKQAEEQIRQLAYHDSLTGLPNRKLFSDRLSIALTQAQRNKKEVGIAMLDLDNFKDVNDTLGHTAGDLLLQATAERLTAALRKGDTVARIGGDEFALILPELKGVEDAIQVAQKIVAGFSKPFLIDTHQLVVTTSIGIAVYPNDGMDGDILLRNADIAMYQAKEAGRDRYQIYNKA